MDINYTIWEERETHVKDADVFKLLSVFTQPSGSPRKRRH